MTLPDFLVIGAGKAGTTSLYYYLRQHPQVYMSPTKETNFFALEGQRVAFRGPGVEERINAWTITELSEYERQFAGVRGERAVGEVCPLYLYSERAAERIKRHVPEVRLIAVLRDPAERAYSAFMHLVRDNREEPDFARALELEEERIRLNYPWIWHYRRAGYYHEQLSRYYALFDPAQIRVYLYEDLRRDPVGTLQDIYRFLGADPAFAPDVSGRYNVSGVPKNRFINDFLRRDNPLKTAVRPLVPARLRGRLRRSLRRRNLTAAPPMPPGVRRDLVAGYREDILRLEELIGRDLSGWLEV